MEEIERGASYTATIQLSEAPDNVDGDDQVYVTLYHDWGGSALVAEQLATLVSSNLYTITFTASQMQSSGVHKIHWRYLIDDDVFVKNDYVDVIQTYISSDTFFAANPELEDEFADHFSDIERQARKTIDSFCNQNFQFYPGKTLTVDGNGQKVIGLPLRVDTLTSTLIDEDDVSDNIELVPETQRYVRYKKQGDSQVGITRTSFTYDSTVEILGDWGWPYVPINIETAAHLLILDLMSEDRENYKFGITRVWMDTQRFDFDPSILTTTGNVDVDTMLMDYVLFQPEVV